MANSWLFVLTFLVFPYFITPYDSSGLNSPLIALSVSILIFPPALTAVDYAHTLCVSDLINI